ncbi:glycine transferase [Pseudomonas sp. AU11447]|nr:glycine transferase [Pseudomonas sp. AU11447]
MQPYFFPYLGYFSLIKHTDLFVLFDTVQYIHHGWIERNRILKQQDGWLYIRVPRIKHHRETLIKDVRLDNRQDWRRSLFSQLDVYRKVAPYYRDVREMIAASLDHPFEDIVSLNKTTLEATCAYLGFPRQMPVLSRMDLPMERPKAPDEWALNICKALGSVEEYWNPPGGQSFFDRRKYDAAGLTLRFQEPKLVPYEQKRPTFEAGLSIIDVMMFNSPADTSRMLDAYELS